MWNQGLLDAIHVGQLVAASNLSKLYSIFKGGDPTKKWYQIQGYQNGREHGITIWLFGDNTTFYICRNRHTDKLGFYKGNHVFTGISDDAYSRGFYAFESIKECAEAIILEIKYICNLI